jgi:hypothetical protein
MCRIDNHPMTGVEFSLLVVHPNRLDRNAVRPDRMGAVCGRSVSDSRAIIPGIS